MTDQWTELIGDFKVLIANPIKMLLGKSLYLTILKHKDNLCEESNRDVDPFYMYETLQMALNPRKKDEVKYTYRGDRTTVDKKTKITKVEKDIDIPMKKFANITGEVKTGLAFLLNKYINECYSCYVDNKKSFVDESQVLTQVCNYAELKCTLPIAPTIIRCTEALDIESLVEGNYANCLKLLLEKLRTYFKGKEDKVPEKQLGTLVDAFIKFMKIIAIYMTDLLYEKRQAVNGVFFYGILRQINSAMRQHGCHIDEELLDNLKEYIDANKPKKETTDKKGKKEKNEEEEDEEEENEENEKEEEEEEPEEKSKKSRGRPTKSNTKEGKSRNKSKDVEDGFQQLEKEWDDEANYGSDE